MKGARTEVKDLESQDVQVQESQWVHEAAVDVRRGFVRKVFTILFIQLLVTFGICIGIGANETSQKYVTENVWPVWVSLVLALGFYIGFVCAPREKTNKHPVNIICLAVITCLFGCLLGVISAQYTLRSVFICIAITCGVVLGLILFACQTRIDLTSKGMYLFTAVWTLLLISIFMPFQNVDEGFWSIGITSLFAFIFAMYIVYDTQLILGGSKRARQFGIDSYVFAALHLYMDIINMFLIVIGGGGNRRD